MIAEHSANLHFFEKYQLLTDAALRAQSFKSFVDRSERMLQVSKSHS